MESYNFFLFQVIPTLVNEVTLQKEDPVICQFCQTPTDQVMSFQTSHDLLVVPYAGRIAIWNLNSPENVSEL